MRKVHLIAVSNKSAVTQVTPRDVKAVELSTEFGCAVEVNGTRKNDGIGIDVSEHCFNVTIIGFGYDSGIEMAGADERRIVVDTSDS